MSRKIKPVSLLPTGESHFGDYYRVKLNPNDAIIVMYNQGGGWVPYRFLLPHQLYEKDVHEKLEELSRFGSEIAVVPINTAEIQIVANLGIVDEE